MLKAQSPLASGNHQIQRPKSDRKALQPKNPPATLLFTPEKVKPTKQYTTEWFEFPLLDSDSNKENVGPVQHPFKSSTPATPAKADPVKIEQFDMSLAEELIAIREKKERLKMDKEKTEKMLEERALFLDIQMKELRNRGVTQKMLEVEVDRLYRLNQLKLSCMISPMQTLREKEVGKGRGKGKIGEMRTSMDEEVKEEICEPSNQKQEHGDEKVLQPPARIM